MRGVFTALVTPFRDGEVDEESFARLVEDQIRAGVAGVVVCGSTGEAATLTELERDRLVRRALALCHGTATRVWVGSGTNCTRTTIELTLRAEEQGADAAMIVTPYYNKPSQEGLYQHFRSVAESTRLPLIAYNVPGRTGVNLLPETVARIHALNRYAAIKEACGSLDQVSDLCTRCSITVLSGDDSLTLPMLSLGATGVVSVVSNLFPAEVGRLVESFGRGDLAGARVWHERLMPVFRAAFWETNPAPIKMLLHHDGRMRPDTRLPLVLASEGIRDRLAAVLAACTWREETAWTPRSS